MADIVEGPVTSVVDGDTFDMRVTHIGTKNKIKYNDVERIRIAGIDAPELDTVAGKHSKEALQKKFSGKTVRCTVQARDTYHRLVADVSIIS